MIKAYHRFFQDFEPFSWRDYAAIPYYMVRYALAWVWYRAWGEWRYWRSKDQPYSRQWAFMWGRHDDPTPVWCARCGWAGPRRWLVHDYQSDGSGMDVEPVDECPKCGGEV